MKLRRNPQVDDKRQKRYNFGHLINQTIIWMTIAFLSVAVIKQIL